MKPLGSYSPQLNIGQGLLLTPLLHVKFVGVFAHPCLEMTADVPKMRFLRSWPTGVKNATPKIASTAGINSDVSQGLSHKRFSGGKKVQCASYSFNLIVAQNNLQLLVQNLLTNFCTTVGSSTTLPSLK